MLNFHVRNREVLPHSLDMVHDLLTLPLPVLLLRGHREDLLPVSGLPGRLGFGRGCWHGLGGGRGGLGQPHLEVGDPGLGPTNYGCTPAQALGARGDSSAGRSQLGVPVELWKTMRFLRFLPVSVPGLEEELGH